MTEGFNIIAELCRRLAGDGMLIVQPKLEWQPPDTENVASVEGLLITLPDETRIILVERTYRPGVYGFQDATDAQVERFRRGDLWHLWNDETGRDVTVVTRDEEGF